VVNDHSLHGYGLPPQFQSELCGKREKKGRLFIDRSSRVENRLAGRWFRDLVGQVECEIINAGEPGLIDDVKGCDWLVHPPCKLLH
jgi:hypothetical protein